MSASGSMNPRPMSSSAERGKKVLRGKSHKGKGDEARRNERVGREQASKESKENEAEPRTDAAELDPQLERAEGEGMVTEHAKVSATDPGPEPLPEPDPEEPEPDHGPGEPDWEAEEERD